MIDPSNHPADLEIERIVAAAFPIPDPDPAFVNRLDSELLERSRGRLLPSSRYFRQRTFNQRSVSQTILRTLALGAFAILLLLTLIWGINNLIPRPLPGFVGQTSPSPTRTSLGDWGILATPSPSSTPSPTTTPTVLLPTLPEPLTLENAITYTIQEGDTLPDIAEKTGVPVETLQNLNEFLLQLNGLVPGLELLAGFEDQVPIFYTVQPGDTFLGIAEEAGISMEEFAALNRIGVYAPGVPTPLPVPHYTLMPGMRVLIGLENKEDKKNLSTGGKQIVLSEIDLDCDGRVERISAIEAPEIEYFNIHPQLSVTQLETNREEEPEIVWEYTAQEAGVTYLAFQIFQASECDNFLVVLRHKGREGVSVLRWNGGTMFAVLELSGRFLFDGAWMEELFGDHQSSPDLLFLGELQGSPATGKNIWVLRGYQWDGETFRMKIIQRVEAPGGG